MHRILLLGNLTPVLVRMLERLNKHPEIIIFDEVRDPVGEYLVQQVMQVKACEPETCPVYMKTKRPYLDNKPQSKGDRHRNKRYRWS